MDFHSDFDISRVCQLVLSSQRTCYKSNDIKIDVYLAISKSKLAAPPVNNYCHIAVPTPPPSASPLLLSRGSNRKRVRSMQLYTRFM